MERHEESGRRIGRLTENDIAAEGFLCESPNNPVSEVSKPTERPLETPTKNIVQPQPAQRESPEDLVLASAQPSCAVNTSPVYNKAKQARNRIGRHISPDTNTERLSKSELSFPLANLVELSDDGGQEHYSFSVHMDKSDSNASRLRPEDKSLELEPSRRSLALAISLNKPDKAALDKERTELATLIETKNNLTQNMESEAERREEMQEQVRSYKEWEDPGKVQGYVDAVAEAKERVMKFSEELKDKLAVISEPLDLLPITASPICARVGELEQSHKVAYKAEEELHKRELAQHQDREAKLRQELQDGTLLGRKLLEQYTFREKEKEIVARRFNSADVERDQETAHVHNQQLRQTRAQLQGQLTDLALRRRELHETAERSRLIKESALVQAQHSRAILQSQQARRTELQASNQKLAKENRQLQADLARELAEEEKLVCTLQNESRDEASRTQPIQTPDWERLKTMEDELNNRLRVVEERQRQLVTLEDSLIVKQRGIDAMKANAHRKVQTVAVPKRRAEQKVTTQPIVDKDAIELNKQEVSYHKKKNAEEADTLHDKWRTIQSCLKNNANLVSKCQEKAKQIAVATQQIQETQTRMQTLKSAARVTLPPESSTATHSFVLASVILLLLVLVCLNLQL